MENLTTAKNHTTIRIFFGKKFPFESSLIYDFYILSPLKSIAKFSLLAIPLAKNLAVLSNF